MGEENREIIARRKDKVIYREGNKVVKLFGEKYSDSDVLNEALNQARIAETGLRVPKLYEVKAMGGQSAIVMEYVEGRTFDSLLAEYPNRQGEILDELVRIQLDVHAHRHLLLTKYIDKLKLKILASDLDASTRYDLSMRLDGMPRHTHVLHGDFLPSNVLLSEDGKAHILDWSHASQGNSTADATKSYLLLRLAGMDALAEEYIARFCRAAGVTFAYMREWIPLIAAAQLLKTEDEGRRKQLLKWTYEEEL